MNAVTRSQIYLVSAQVARIVLFVASISLLGRLLAPEDFGFLALLTSLYIVAIEILDMGTTAVSTRIVAASPSLERETLTSLIALRRVISIVLSTAVIVFALSAYVTRDDQRMVLVAAAAGICLLHLYSYMLVFQVRQAYGPSIAMGLAGQFGFLAASAIALKLHAGGAVIGLLVVARELLLVLGNRWIALRRLGYRLRAPLLHPGALSLLKAGWMLGVGGVCYKLSTYSGGFLLWTLASPEALATFSAAQRLMVPVGEMAWLFATPLIASMSVALTLGVPGFRLQLAGNAKFLFGMSSLVAVAGYFVAPFLLRILYGEQYASGALSAAGTMRWLALGYLFAIVTPVFVVGEIALGHLRAIMFTSMACLGLNLAANAWAIPKFGAEGAAMVLCSCEAFMFTVLFVRSVARRDIRVDGTWAAYPIPALLLGIALSLLVESPGLQFALACAWAPVALFVIVRRPEQRACRSSRATVPANLMPGQSPQASSIPTESR